VSAHTAGGASKDERRIASLDGLRAVSIILVILSHCDLSLPSNTFGTVIEDSLRNGALGVSIFFVISGFLITRLLLVEHRETGTIDLRAFYLRRVLRIFPAYYLNLFVLLVLAAVGLIIVDPTCWLSSAFFLRNYATPPEHHHDWLTVHFWSLAVEEQFYLFWPTAVVLCGLAGARRLALLLVATAPLVRVVSYFLLPSMRNEFGFFTHTRMDTLMFGCLAALLRDEPAFKAVLARAYRCWLPALALAFLAFFSAELERRLGRPYYLTVGWSLDGLAITLVVLWSIDHADGWVGRALNSRPVVHLGVISFSLYLWQQLFLSLHRPWSPLAALLAAEASYRLVEQPLVALRRRLERRRAPARTSLVNRYPAALSSSPEPR
jgi:peptidoglycan/LPS O-acetylase OafA/YrhL